MSADVFAEVVMGLLATGLAIMLAVVTFAVLEWFDRGGDE